MKKFNKKWFTLIEMLIVVVIIGILASALIPRLTSVKDRANDSSRKAALQQLVTAMSMYVLDNSIPITAAWSTGDTADSSAAWSGIQVALSKWGMKSIPTDPSNKSDKLFGKDTTGYVYFSAKKWGISNNWFIFAGRAETEGAANWVENTTTAIDSTTDIDTLVLCDKVTLSTFTANKCDGPKTKFRMIMKY